MLREVISFLLIIIVYCQIASGAIAINENWKGSGYLWTSTGMTPYSDMMAGNGDWSYTRMLGDESFGSYAQFNGTDGSYRIAYSGLDFTHMYSVYKSSNLIAASSISAGLSDISMSGNGSVRSFLITPTSDGRHWDELARSYASGTFNVRSVISSGGDDDGNSEDT